MVCGNQENMWGKVSFFRICTGLMHKPRSDVNGAGLTCSSAHPLCLFQVPNCTFAAVTKHTGIIAVCTAKCSNIIYSIPISAGLSNVGHGISSHFDGDELKDNLIRHHIHARTQPISQQWGEEDDDGRSMLWWFPSNRAARLRCQEQSELGAEQVFQCVSGITEN